VLLSGGRGLCGTNQRHSDNRNITKQEMNLMKLLGRRERGENLAHYYVGFFWIAQLVSRKTLEAML
jgi:hypothetical protein